MSEYRSRKTRECTGLALDQAGGFKDLLCKPIWVWRLLFVLALGVVHVACTAHSVDRVQAKSVTRAKKKVIVITSLPVAQISDVFGPAGTAAPTRVSGRDYLQAYMRYAQAVARGDHETMGNIAKQLIELGKLIGIPGLAKQAPVDFESDFEASVFDSLSKRGFKVDTQVGDSGFRIDLAIRHG